MEIQMEINANEASFEERLAAVEAKLAQLLELQTTAVANTPYTVTNHRKTLAASATTLLAKQNVAVDSLEASALDSALSSLSIEQRIAVKAQLFRTGLVS